MGARMPRSALLTEDALFGKRGAKPETGRESRPFLKQRRDGDAPGCGPVGEVLRDIVTVYGQGLGKGHCVVCCFGRARSCVWPKCAGRVADQRYPALDKGGAQRIEYGLHERRFGCEHQLCQNGRQTLSGETGEVGTRGRRELSRAD
jgi:hypothetical protein